MRKQIATAGMLVLGGIAFGGAPIINPSSVTMTQDDDTRRVTINYKLEEAPAVVTVDIRTNGVSIGAQNLQYFAGDVTRLSRSATGRSTGSRTRPGRATRSRPA